MAVQAQAHSQVETLVPVSGIVEEHYWRQGDAYTDERIVSIIAAKPEGTVIEAVFDEFDAGYPYIKGYNKLIAATTKTEYIIVRIERRSSEDEYTMYYVYIKGFGWWHFTNNDAYRVDAVSPEEIQKILERAERVCTV